MSKVDIKRLDSVTKNDTTATEQINDNFQALQAAIENTVSRDGTVPNYMDADLDLNSYRIINAGDPVGERDVVTLKYFEEKAGGAIEAAAEAKASASKAASSAQSALVASNNAIGQLAQAEGLLIAAEGQLEDTKQYIDAAKSDIDSTVAQAKSDINTAVSNAESNISTIVSDAEGSITNIAVTEANKAIANAAQEATDMAKANVNSYVDGTVKPSLQTYVDQAQAEANSAATSMEQAALSATAASNYASNASADADNAAESAGLAANSANAANVSEANAKASETNALIWAEGTDAQVQALGGEKSAKGWAEASTNLDYTKISNCITAIPQDIKLELNNGTLTLKAGSKVYVPNGKNADGSNKFDVLTIANDTSLTQEWGSSQTFLLFYDANGLRLRIYDTGRCYSGTTSVSDGAYYNTNDNKLYVYDGGSLNFQTSLPIAIITGQSPTITSIDQVFNGFGYIGSTIFSLPGVKGLIPKGRNADGTLKNTEFAISQVKTTTLNSSSSGNYKMVSNQTGIYCNNTTIYDEITNTNSTARHSAESGTLSVSNGVVTSFTPKTAFHAVDYSDFKAAIAEIGGGLEIGDIGFAPLGIDEAQNKRRYLNGQVISQAQFVSFTNKVKSAIELYPNLATTETNWQAEKTNSKLGQCGKFVVDDTAGTIRLPCVVNAQGLLSLSGIGNLVNESLPNITGSTTAALATTTAATPSGAIYASSSSGNPLVAGGTSYGSLAWNLDASRSSSTYQDNAPVQQEAVQYPYYIQVATGVEETLPAIREYEINTPFFFGQSMYSDVAPDNASWLASNGQYNAKTVYPDYYDWLVEQMNAGVSGFVASTAAYTDYDFVINTTDQTFRLPVLSNRILVEKKEPTDADQYWYNLYSDGWLEQGGVLETSQATTVTFVKPYITTPNVMVTAKSMSTISNAAVVITTNVTLASFSVISGGWDNKGIFTSEGGSAPKVWSAQGYTNIPQNTTWNLYFYVGDTVQDASLINAGAVLGQLSDKISRTSASDKELVVGWGMPDYSAGISITSYTSSNNKFTAPCDGVITVAYLTTTASGLPYINDLQFGSYNAGEVVSNITQPVNKGDTFFCTGIHNKAGSGCNKFYPLKGVI